MTVKQLKEFLENVPDDFEIKVANAYLQEDYEIDEYSILVYGDEKVIKFLD